MDILDIDSVETADVAILTIHHPATGAATTWKMQIAGPGHAATLALQNEVARERLREEKAQEQARANGRKWKATDLDPEEERLKSMRRVSRRIIGWSDVTLNGQAFPYSAENAFLVMSDPKRGWIAQQVMDFFGSDAAFIKSSART
ncbi:hypothetical protein [Falsiroseomonas selenitidurans]|uniref:Uncharacterized protein n=1 Tax=Falsiroseomonas selenitidurans TaxID=2716335 RepID=A0ABX1E3W2_9PROT|nr:hypothetical protein [Falsiroseomonas selenitidurans]NKC30202.1 hypothetical protein [Falsiroseomonas selenitidurans]